MKNTVTVNSFPGKNMEGLIGFRIDGETDRHTLVPYPQIFSDRNHRIDVILQYLCPYYALILGFILTFL